MAFSNPTPLVPGAPQVLPLQDRILTWAYSACFHTLALAAVSVASVALREPPQTPIVLARMEILLSETPDLAEQSAPTASPAQIDPATPQEAAALAEDSSEDSSPVAPAPSSSTARRTVQRVASETPPSPTADTSTASTDHTPAESPEPAEHHGEPSTSAPEPVTPAPPSSAESAEQAESPAATNAPPEPIAEVLTDHAAAAPQPDVSSSTAPPATSMDSSQTEAAAIHHPVVTQSISGKSQYAWLMELLRRRIVSLQAYPHLARMQGWEGVVVVKTTIDSNGDLLDAVVTKSSGYGALDEDAVRLMHRVCPVHLTRDLGKSRIAVMVPIRYRLDGIDR